MGMGEDEFWHCTPRYFAAKQKAWLNTQRRQWELARFTGWLSVLPHVSKKGGLRITDLYRFDWEEKPKAREIPPEELEALRKFQEDAKRIFEKQFGVTFKDAPAEPAMNGHD